MPKLKFDERSVRDAALPDGKRQLLYFDTRTAGFGLLIGASTKTWVAQRDLPGGKTRRVTLGRYPDMTLTDARAAAMRKLAAMLDGVDPNAERRQRVLDQELQAWQKYTLREAVARHSANMKAKGCSARSISDTETELERHLSDWLDLPLASITRAMCDARHRELSDKKPSKPKQGGLGRGGPYVANRVFRIFRACYNDARKKLYPELPPCPVEAITFNAEDRRREPIPWASLPAWWTWVETKHDVNPVRADYQVFVLLTGLRRRDAATVKWSEIDWNAGTLHRPCPKGGERKAMTLPLSAYLLKLLAKRQLGNRLLFSDGDGGLVFPARDASGKVIPISEPKESCKLLAKDGKPLVRSPHRLRDTFATAANEAGVDWLTIQTLMNHSLTKSSVTAGYMRPSMEHLRAAAEKITAFILAKAGAVETVADAKKSA